MNRKTSTVVPHVKKRRSAIMPDDDFVKARTRDAYERWMRDAGRRSCCCGMATNPASDARLGGDFDAIYTNCADFRPSEKVHSFGGQSWDIGESHCTSGGCSGKTAWGEEEVSDGLYEMGPVQCPLYKARHPIIQEIV